MSGTCSGCGNTLCMIHRDAVLCPSCVRAAETSGAEKKAS